MSQQDQIKKKQLIDAPETVTTEWFSPSVSLDDRLGPFSISVKYENGSSVNMKVFFQLSNDDVNFGSLTDSETIITDNSGVIIYDLEGSGCQYARIKIEVTAGSIDVLEIKYVGSQLH